MNIQRTALLVCGGMHPPSYTGQVLATIARDEVLSQLGAVVCAPQHALGVVSPFALRRTLEARLEAMAPGEAMAGASSDVIIWAFSAGCVGAAALATYWQRYRGPVLALLLVDGWGVARDPGVPTYRLSHDAATHTTSRWLGAGDIDFYADPAVPHLTLWQHPQGVSGWAIKAGERRQRLTAADFLCQRSRAAIDRYRTERSGSALS
ncbi:MAG: hypothetical protein WBA99_15070 [Nodosilinea sp.]